MESCIDFLQWLDVDMSLNILMCLDDPSDLIRASSVSRFWQNFVTANGLCKQLCVRTFPQLASVAHIIEPNSNSRVPSSIERGIREREHRVYASLFQALTTFPLSYCIADPVSASSTDNYPEESLANTLDPRDRVLIGASYWSSKGCSDPEVPETLIYHLSASLCAITEINIHPFQAYFQPGRPIYSSRSVRFRMGHPKRSSVLGHNFLDSQECADDKFIWTYLSQEFPMVQENCLQRFKLPEPAICIGGFLQVEFLGRIQRQEMDNLFYICVSHVQAIGRLLSPAFDVVMSEPLTLKYNAEGFNRTLRSLSDGSVSSNLPPLSPPDEFVWGNLEDFNHFMEMLEQEPPPVVEPQYEWWFDDDNEHDPFMM